MVVTRISSRENMSVSTMYQQKLCTCSVFIHVHTDTFAILTSKTFQRQLYVAEDVPVTIITAAVLARIRCPNPLSVVIGDERVAIQNAIQPRLCGGPIADAVRTRPCRIYDCFPRILDVIGAKVVLSTCE